MTDYDGRSSSSPDMNLLGREKKTMISIERVEIDSHVKDTGRRLRSQKSGNLPLKKGNFS